MHKVDELMLHVYHQCEEVLEMIPAEHRGGYLASVLVRLLSKEKELTDYYKKRLEEYER